MERTEEEEDMKGKQDLDWWERTGRREENAVKDFITDDLERCFEDLHKHCQLYLKNKEKQQIYVK